MTGYSDKGMSLIVKTVTRLTLGFILLYGIYLAVNSQTSPGGGFAGGVIVALSFVHIMLAFGKEAALRKLHSNTLRVLISSSALVFLCFIMATFTRPRLWLADTVISLGEMVIVGFGLFAIFVALVLLSKKDKDAE